MLGMKILFQNQEKTEDAANWLTDLYQIQMSEINPKAKYTIHLFTEL